MTMTMVGLIFLDFALGLAKLNPNNILERRFTSIELLPYTTLLAVVKRDSGLLPSIKALIGMKTIVGVHVLTGYGAIATHMTCLTSRSNSM
jgi:ActR/RegA family two-component response regulator